MIELPASPVASAVEIRLLDFGFVQRPASGAAALRIDRPGSRWRAELAFAPMAPALARTFSARLARAKRDGLRVRIPLLGVSQGVPGAPVVDGAGQSGITLAVRGLTPGYQALEGFWLHIEDGDGVRYVHQLASDATADGSGEAEFDLEPPLRAPFADGDAIELVAPTIEGILAEDVGWSLGADRLVRFGGKIAVEEAV